jgi:hypothetical protein
MVHPRIELNLIYAHEKGTAFSARTSAKLTNLQRRYVPVCCTEFHPNRARCVQSTYENPFTPLSAVWPAFTPPMLTKPTRSHVVPVNIVPGCIRNRRKNVQNAVKPYPVV